MRTLSTVKQRDRALVRDAVALVRSEVLRVGRRAVADAIPTSERTIERWERGDNEPTVNMARRVLAVLPVRQ